MSDINNRPPPVLDSAHVIGYAIVDDSVVYTGKRALNLDNELLGSVSRLAIGQNLADGAYLLLYCDETWSVLGVSGGDSIEEIKRTAEKAYKGITQKWQPSEVSKEQAQQYQDELMGGLVCSFCGKRPEQIQSIVRSAHAAICNECVAAFHRDLSSD